MMFLSKVVSRSGKREDVIEFMQVAGFSYGIAIVFSFRIESSKCPLKKKFIGSKKPLAHICEPTILVFWTKLGGGSSWERRGKWHGGWYLDGKLTWNPDRRLAWGLNFWALFLRIFPRRCRTANVSRKKWEASWALNWFENAFAFAVSTSRL